MYKILLKIRKWKNRILYPRTTKKDFKRLREIEWELEALGKEDQRLRKKYNLY